MDIFTFMQNGSNVSKIRENNRASQRVRGAGSLQVSLNRQSKWISLTLFGIVLLWRHDGEALWAAMGMVINFILSLKLKSLLNHKRPDASKRSDPGMPSSHSQSNFYISMYILFLVGERVEIYELSLTICGLNLACATYLSWLRVSTMQHTMSQVIAGAAAGSLYCSYWYYMWYAIVVHAFSSYLWIRIFVGLETFGFWIWFVPKLL